MCIAHPFWSGGLTISSSMRYRCWNAKMELAKHKHGPYWIWHWIYDSDCKWLLLILYFHITAISFQQSSLYFSSTLGHPAGTSGNNNPLWQKVPNHRTNVLPSSPTGCPRSFNGNGIFQDPSNAHMSARFVGPRRLGVFPVAGVCS